MLTRIVAIALALVVWIGNAPAYAQFFPSMVVDGQRVLAPDFNRTSFGDLPPVEEAGEINIGKFDTNILRQQGITDPRIEKILGYNPNRSWTAGTPVADIVQLGDFYSFGLGEQTLSQIAALSGTNLNTTKLSEFGGIKLQTIQSLAEAIPEVANTPINSIPLLQDFVANVSTNPVAKDLLSAADRQAIAKFVEKHPYLAEANLSSILDGDVPGAIADNERLILDQLKSINPVLGEIPLGAIAQGDFKQAGTQLLRSGVKVLVKDLVRNNPVLANVPIGAAALDLTQYPLTTAVPRLAETALSKLNKSGQLPIGEIPGLKKIPIAKILRFKDLLKIQFAKVDLTLGEAELTAENALSGSTRNDEYKAVPCVVGQNGVKNCPHIELADQVKLPGLSVLGRQWIRGRSQMVEGGKGLLRVINGGKEPTGLVPWGPEPNLKLVVGDINESTGTAKMELYLRVCIKRAFVDLGCTPYFIGPIPFGQVKEKGLVLVASTGAAPKVKIPPDQARQIADIKGQYIQPEVGPCGDLAKERKTKYGHRQFDEERTENLIPVGSYRGHRTEYMEKEAGEAFKRMVNDSGGILMPISGYRTIEDQSVLWERQVRRKGSEEAAARVSAPAGFSEHHTGLTIDIGDRDWSKADLAVSFENTSAFKWLAANGGKYGFELSFPRGNSQGVSYEPWHWRFKGSQKAQQIFNPNNNRSSKTYGAGACTFTATPCEPGKPCKLFNPNPKGIIVSKRNLYNACRDGCSRLHAGVDLQSPTAARNSYGPGDPIYSIADGKVSEYIPVGGKCGGVISVVHPKIGLESRYLHMIKLTVPRGATVKRGQQIGVEGDELSNICSFGAHLHIELYSLKTGLSFDPVTLDYEPPMPRSPQY